jgi:hypothetical protein
MLKSAKDRALGVDTLGQQMPPHVRYGTACLLIRDVVGSLPCSVEWEIMICANNLRVKFKCISTNSLTLYLP